jgi:hypothetical protein
MLKQEIKEFCSNWLEKTNNLDDNTLSDVFDKFFTLYVVYNRLYVETTFRLSNKGQINLTNRTSFPDNKAATKYVSQFLGSNKIFIEFEKEIFVNAISLIINILENHSFYIKLHQVNGMPQPDEDDKLLKKLKSKNVGKKIDGILDFIYSVRCNIFHAQKGYQIGQLEVLNPANVLLKKLIELLIEKLDENSN